MIYDKPITSCHRFGIKPKNSQNKCSPQGLALLCPTCEHFSLHIEVLTPLVRDLCMYNVM